MLPPGMEAPMNRDPGSSSHPETVSAALALLASEGYEADFSARSEGIHCARCGQPHSVEGARVDRIYRFEGNTDPADQAIVLALRCPSCGAKGVLVSGYGPTTDPAEVALILSLRA